MNSQQSKFDKALQLHHSGLPQEAIPIYRDILRKDKKNPYLLFLLGTALSQTGNLEEGIQHLQKSSVLSPNPITYNNIGTIFAKTNKNSEAIENFNNAIALVPSYAEAYSNRGAALRNLGLLDESLESCNYAIQLDPTYADAFNNKGYALYELNRLDEALFNYDRAIELKPDYVEAYSNRGVVLQKLKRLDEALASQDMAIALRPDYAEAYTNRGVILQKLKRLDEALASQDMAIALKPHYAEAYTNRGVVLQELKRLDEALASQDMAIALKPDYAEAYSNRGVILEELKRLNEALADFNKAIQLNPKLIDAYWNKSLIKLLIGDYSEGWDLYEYRWETKLKKPSSGTYPKKTWLGNESISGKTILIYPEQGLGDVIQFSRYVPLLVEQGANVIFEVPKPLVNIMQTLPCDVTIVESGRELPLFDLQCPIMSLPLAFKTTVETIPNKIPYLFASSEKSAHWQQKIANRLTFRVGLVWSGGFRPNQPEVWAVNEKRNIPLTKLHSLKISGVDFYSLQKGDDAIEQLVRLKESSWDGPNIIDFSDDFDDFSDTAALIQNLDLIIAVDTSTAHIAGAMGKPVWLLNRFDTDWRWFSDKEISPWYPTIRIFRQPSLGDWDAVVANVKNTLEKLVLEK